MGIGKAATCRRAFCGEWIRFPVRKRGTLNAGDDSTGVETALAARVAAFPGTFRQFRSAQGFGERALDSWLGSLASWFLVACLSAMLLERGSILVAASGRFLLDRIAHPHGQRDAL